LVWFGWFVASPSFSSPLYRKVNEPFNHQEADPFVLWLASGLVWLVRRFSFLLLSTLRKANEPFNHQEADRTTPCREKSMNDQNPVNPTRNSERPQKVNPGTVGRGLTDQGEPALSS
jgi:hypothetical protein